MAYTHIISNGIKTVPYVECIGFTKDIIHSSFGPGRRKSYTIHFNLKGSGYFNGTPVNAGQGFLVYDGAYAHHYANKADPWELFWITLADDEISKQIFLQYNVNKKTNIFNFHSSVYVKEVAKKICEEKSVGIDSLKLLDMFLQIHHNCMEYSNTLQPKSTPELYVKSATKYIKTNLHHNVTVNELVEKIGITQPYLYKLFKEKFGISPKEYILKTKLDTAKSLLLTTNMSITEIANSVGFLDVLTFSRFFSSKEKLSPTLFRKSNTNK